MAVLIRVGRFAPASEVCRFSTFWSCSPCGGGLGRLAFQLAPLYFNNMRLVASLEGLKAQPEWYTWSREDILDALRKRWAIDPVDHVTAQEVRVECDVGKTRVRVTYDVVQPFFRNVELLVHFDEAIEEIRH